jgi:hypothetical protein
MKVVGRIIRGNPGIASGVTSRSIANEIPLVKREESVGGRVKGPMIHGWTPSSNDVRKIRFLAIFNIRRNVVEDPTEIYKLGFDFNFWNSNN